MTTVDLAGGEIVACLAEPDLAMARATAIPINMCTSFAACVALVEEASMPPLAVVSYLSFPDAADEFEQFAGLCAVLIVIVGSQAESLRALERGATVTLMRPMTIDTFAAATLALMRRLSYVRQLLTRSPLSTVGELTVQFSSHSVERQGVTVNLSRREWQLFVAFLSRPGEYLTRRELADAAWGRTAEVRREQIELYVSRLRVKVETDPHHPVLIETVRGKGYRLSPTAVVSESATRLVDPQRRLHRAQPTLEEHDARRCHEVYNGLVGIASDAITTVSELVHGQSTAARRELFEADLALLESVVERSRSRRDIWQRRISPT